MSAVLEFVESSGATGHPELLQRVFGIHRDGAGAELGEVAH